MSWFQFTATITGIRATLLFTAMADTREQLPIHGDSVGIIPTTNLAPGNYSFAFLSRSARSLGNVC